MSEEEENEEVLEPEEAQDVVNWAVDTAAVLTLLVHTEEAESLEDKAEKLETFMEACAALYDKIPDPISDTAHDIAVAAVEGHQEEESIVEEFRRQIEAL